MDNNQQARWGSHIPINKTLLAVFDITGVMELGMGLFSTPLFTSLSPRTVSVECDIEWINNLKAKGISNSKTHKIIHHVIEDEDVNRSTNYKEVTNTIKQKANLLYEQHLTDDINYLFIDCYAGLRLSALQSLYEKMDIIVFHDAGIRDSQLYGYDQFIEHPNYTLFHDSSFSPWTGFLIKNSLLDNDKFEQIKQLHNKYFTDHVKNVPSYSHHPKLIKG